MKAAKLIFIALTMSVIMIQANSAAAATYAISQLDTGMVSDDLFPAINNQGQIVWYHTGCQFQTGEPPVTYTETGKYLFYQNGSVTPLNIHTNTDPPWNYTHAPQLLFNNLGQIGYVIEDYNDGGKYKAYFHDGPNGSPQLANGNGYPTYDLQLNQQGQMAWDSYVLDNSDNNINLQVFLFNNGQGQGVPLTNYVYAGSNLGFSGGLSLNDAGHVLWSDRLYDNTNNVVQTIRLHKDGITQGIYSTPSSMFFLQINNQGQVVWLEQDQGTGLGNIMLYDRGSVKVVPGGDGFLWGYVTYLQINEKGQVMWLGKKTTDQTEYNIYLYSHGITTQVTHYTNDGTYNGTIDLYENSLTDVRTKFGPYLNNNGGIVWITRVPNNTNPTYYDLSVQAYSGGRTTQLDHWTVSPTSPTFSTQVAMHAAYAQINDAGQVTWSRYKGAIVPDYSSDFEIYLATPVTVDITSTAGSNGTISQSATVNYRGSFTFAITPDAGYHVADVLVDGGSVGAVASYTFNNVTADHMIGATFIKIGDVNNDSHVDLTDAILALQVISGISPRQIYVKADVNNDGKIGLPEALYALQRASGL